MHYSSCHFCPCVPAREKRPSEGCHFSRGRETSAGLRRSDPPHSRRTWTESTESGVTYESEGVNASIRDVNRRRPGCFFHPGYRASAQQPRAICISDPAQGAWGTGALGVGYRRVGLGGSRPEVSARAAYEFCSIGDVALRPPCAPRGVARRPRGGRE